MLFSRELDGIKARIFRENVWFLDGIGISGERFKGSDDLQK
jgi:hypothetical protein